MAGAAEDVAAEAELAGLGDGATTPAGDADAVGLVEADAATAALLGTGDPADGDDDGVAPHAAATAAVSRAARIGGRADRPMCCVSECLTQDADASSSRTAWP